MSKEYRNKVESIINTKDIDDSEKVSRIKGVGANLDAPNAPNAPNAPDAKDPQGGNQIEDKDMSEALLNCQNASDYPKTYYMRHMEKGLASYPENKETVLIEDGALRNMMPTLNNKPIYIWHKEDGKDTPQKFDEGMHGVVSNSFFNELDSWYWAKTIIFTDEGKNKIEAGWLPSNSYSPSEVNKNPGTYHNMKYDTQILNGYYKHIALVPNPRYEGCLILTPDEYKSYNNELKTTYQNSKKKEKTMKFWKKQEIEEKDVTLDSFREINGKSVQVSELVTNYQNEKKEESKKTKATELEIDGKMVSMKDLDNCYIEVQNKNLQNAKEGEEGKEYFDNMQNAIDKGLVDNARKLGQLDEEKHEVKIDLRSDQVERGKNY